MRTSERRWLLLMVDVIVVNVSVLLALGLWSRRQGAAFSLQYIVSGLRWFAFVTILWVVVGYANNLYDVRTAASRLRTTMRLVQTACVVFLIYTVVYFFLPPQSRARVPVLFSEVIAFFLLASWRWLYATVLTGPRFQRPAVILGIGSAGRTMARAIQEHLPYEYNLIGYIEDNPGGWGERPAGLPVLGGPDQLMEVVQAKEVAEIIVAVTHSLSGELVQALIECNDRGVQITQMTALYEEITGRVPVEYAGSTWLFDLPFGGEASIRPLPSVKRALDVIVALAGLILSAPLYPLIALAIVVDDRGPIFYWQDRAGHQGKRFRMVKFRSMITSAESGGKARWAQQSDPRATRVGRFLRRTRLDEVPQLINVLRGDMSVVGPRPERPEFLDEFKNKIPFYRLRLQVKPGVTGSAQVHYRYASSVEDTLTKLEYDLYYIKHQSLYLDLLILWKTLGVVLRFEGT